MDGIKWRRVVNVTHAYWTVERVLWKEGSDGALLYTDYAPDEPTNMVELHFPHLHEFFYADSVMAAQELVRRYGGVDYDWRAL